MLNPSKCDYKYNKAWKIGEYLDHAKLFHAENVYMLNRYQHVKKTLQLKPHLLIKK